MKSFSRRTFAATALALSAGAAFAQPAPAQELGNIVIEKAWTRATPASANVSAGFFAVTNIGSETDRLSAIDAPFANRVELHEMSMLDGRMLMRPVPDGLEIKPGKTVTLAPGGYHLMFLQLQQPLLEHDTVSAVLHFERAGKIEVDFAVRSIGAKSFDNS